MSIFAAFRTSGVVAKQFLKYPTVANSKEISSMISKREISSRLSNKVFPESNVAAGELKGKVIDQTLADLKTKASATEGATWYERSFKASRELMWGQQKHVTVDCAPTYNISELMWGRQHYESSLSSGVKDMVNATIEKATTLKNDVTSKISANVTKDMANASIEKAATLKNDVTSKISANVTKQFITEADITFKITKASKELAIARRNAAKAAEDLVKNKVGLANLIKASENLNISIAAAKAVGDLAMNKVATPASRMSQAVTKAPESLVEKQVNTKAASTWWDRSSNIAYKFAYGRHGKMPSSVASFKNGIQEGKL